MKINTLLVAIAVFAAVLMIVLGLTSPAWAQIYVIESTVPEIKVGAALATADSLKIPAGASIRAVLPSGKTQTIKGPYSGSVADLAKGQDVNEGVVGWLKNIMQTGGATEATPGATRSARVATPRPLVARFSWIEIPTSVDGNLCVAKGANLQLARAPVPVAQRVAVVDVERAARGEMAWPVGGDLVAWPAEVTVRPGASYDLIIEGRPRRQVKLEVLERLPAEDDLLAELQKRGCRHQFENFVREKLALAKR
jgi:hypothetical protein